MKRIPPSVQMEQARTARLQAGFAGHPLRQFVARAAELMLQVGLEAQVETFFGRSHYACGSRLQAGWRNGYDTHTLTTEAGPLTLRPPKVRGTVTPFRASLPAALAQGTPELRTLVTHAYVRGLSVRDVAGLYAEVPVVATAVGGIPEQVKGLEHRVGSACYPIYGPAQATGMLVRPGDAEGMATAIELLLRNDPLRLQMAQNAATDASQRFDLNRQADEYLAWYREISERWIVERSTFQPLNLQRGSYALSSPE